MWENVAVVILQEFQVYVKKRQCNFNLVSKITHLWRPEWPGKKSDYPEAATLGESSDHTERPHVGGPADSPSWGPSWYPAPTITYVMSEWSATSPQPSSNPELSVLPSSDPTCHGLHAIHPLPNVCPREPVDIITYLWLHTTVWGGRHASIMTRTSWLEYPFPFPFPIMFTLSLIFLSLYLVLWGKGEKVKVKTGAKAAKLFYSFSSTSSEYMLY